MAPQYELSWIPPAVASPEIRSVGDALSRHLPAKYGLPHVWRADIPTPKLEFLRSGGSGHVYTITSGIWRRSYCVKVLRADRAHEAEATEAFLREPALLTDVQRRAQGEKGLWARVGATTDRHYDMVPPVAPTLDGGNHSDLEVDGRKAPFFILERGITLSDLLKPTKELDTWSTQRRTWFWKWFGPSGPGAMAEDALYEMLRQLDFALQGLHWEGDRAKGDERAFGFHLDIKPENVLAVFMEPNQNVDDVRVPTAEPQIRYCMFDFGSFLTPNEFLSRPWFESTYDTLPEYVQSLVSLRDQSSDKRVRVPLDRLRQLVPAIRGDQVDRHQLGQIIVDLFAGTHPFGELRNSVRRDGRQLLLELAKSLLYSAEPDDPARIEPGVRSIQEIHRQIHAIQSVPNRVGGSSLVLLPGSSIQGIDERIEAITQQPLFSRLRHVRQLGLSYLVYPGATHTRYEHLLGAFDAARDYLWHLLSPSGSPWLAARVSVQQVEQCLLYALCHDLGHYPFAHYLEDTGLFPDHSALTRAILTRDLNALGLACEGDVCGTRHSKGTCRWRLVEEGHLDSLHAALFAGFGLQRERWQGWFAATDRIKKSRPRTAADGVFKVLNDILDGPIDIDKYDYVRRDAAHAGFGSFGGVETELLLRSLTVCADPNPGAVVERYVLGVREQARCVLGKRSTDDVEHAG